MSPEEYLQTQRRFLHILVDAVVDLVGPKFFQNFQLQEAPPSGPTSIPAPIRTVQNSVHVEALRRADAVLEEILNARDGILSREIQDRLGITKRMAMGALKKLRGEGLVRMEGAPARYFPGPAVSRIRDRDRDQDDDTDAVVLKCLNVQRDGMAMRDFVAVMKGSKTSIRRAVLRLESDGKIQRRGEGASTKYVLAASSKAQEEDVFPPVPKTKSRQQEIALIIRHVGMDMAKWALERVPKPFREAVRLIDFQGRPTSEVCVVLRKANTQQLYNDLSKGRQALEAGILEGLPTIKDRVRTLLMGRARLFVRTISKKVKCTDDEVWKAIRSLRQDGLQIHGQVDRTRGFVGHFLWMEE